MMNADYTLSRGTHGEFSRFVTVLVEQEEVGRKAGYMGSGEGC
jgi:hypothetical protein